MRSKNQRRAETGACIAISGGRAPVSTNTAYPGSEGEGGESEELNVEHGTIPKDET